MKTLLTTTAVAFALAMTNVAVATTFSHHAESSTELNITFQSDLSFSLLVESENFFRGDFDCGSGTALTYLSTDDFYSGMGAAAVSTIRSIT